MPKRSKQDMEFKLRSKRFTARCRSTSVRCVIRRVNDICHYQRSVPAPMLTVVLVMMGANEPARSWLISPLQRLWLCIGNIISGERTLMRSKQSKQKVPFYNVQFRSSMTFVTRLILSSLSLFYLQVT